jgi:hypothetical protein
MGELKSVRILHPIPVVYIYIYIYIYIYMFNEGKEHDQLRIILGNNHHNNNHNNILLPFKRERERQNTLER